MRAFHISPRLASLPSLFSLFRLWQPNSVRFNPVEVRYLSQVPERYRKPPQAPPKFTATPQRLLADNERLIAQSKTLYDAIVASVEPESATFDNVILPVAENDNGNALEAKIIAFYSAVSPDKALRDASTNATRQLCDYAIEASMREDMFQLVRAAAIEELLRSFETKVE
jgi:Zn-dependent oligopeptidase